MVENDTRGAHTPQARMDGQPAPGAPPITGRPGQSAEEARGGRWRGAFGSRHPNVALILALLLYKVAVLTVPLFYACFLPGSFSAASFTANFHRRQKPDFSSRFSTWDGEHYLYLSQHGYQAGSPSDAFYPLWPAMIRAGAMLTGGHPLVAALVLSNVLSLAGLLLLHRLVATTQDPQTANWALALLVAYPGSLFFQFAYSESLFLLLIVLFFSGLFRADYRLASFTGFLLPLTRATGVFCLLPLGWHVWEQARANGRGEGRRSLRQWVLLLARQRSAPVILAPVLGYAAYFAIMALFTGNPFAGFAAEKHYLNQPSIANILDVPDFIGSFFHLGWRHGMTDSPIDRAFFVLFVVSLPGLWRLNKLYFLYALGAGLVPAMSHWFFSYTRFLVLCFPLFIVLAGRFGGRRDREGLWYGILLMAAIQSSFLVRYVNCRWAG